jgi:hypothetical protein
MGPCMVGAIMVSSYCVIGRLRVAAPRAAESLRDHGGDLGDPPEVPHFGPGRRYRVAGLWANMYGWRRSP